MKKLFTGVYIIESILLVVPIFMILSDTVFLLFSNTIPNPFWFYVLYIIIIPIYIFLVVTLLIIIKRIIYKRKQQYPFDNTLYLTLSAIVSLVLILINGYFEFVFIYFLFPLTIILWIVLVIGPVLHFFIPSIKIKNWVGLFLIFLYSIFTSLTFMGIIVALAGGSV